MYVGTSTWNIPKNEIKSFPQNGSHLERYSKIFNAVEINTSFYKDHLSKSYSKWSDVTPSEFCFSVKLNHRFTHTCEDFSTIDLSNSLESMAYLKNKWRVLLIQFPSGKKFNASYLSKILKIIRKRFSGMVVIEPRNISWICNDLTNIMSEYNVSKVTSDPEKCPGVEEKSENYFRFHGSPEIYHSQYDDSYLRTIFQNISTLNPKAWCIFNNTTFGYATTNALAFLELGKNIAGVNLFSQDCTTLFELSNQVRQ